MATPQRAYGIGTARVKAARRRRKSAVAHVPSGVITQHSPTFDLGGPDVLTYREMIERIAALRRRRRAIVEVPILSPRLSSYWLHLVTPVRAGVARPLVEGLRNPTVVRDDRICQLLPRALTSFDAAARAALDQV